MKIDESRLPSVLRVLSLCSQVCIFVTFSFILVIELAFFDAWKYPISFFLVICVLVTFGIGCLGASVIFCNLSDVRARRPDFALLVFICLLPMAGAQYVSKCSGVLIVEFGYHRFDDTKKEKEEDLIVSSGLQRSSPTEDVYDCNYCDTAFNGTYKQVETHELTCTARSVWNTLFSPLTLVLEKLF